MLTRRQFIAASCALAGATALPSCRPGAPSRTIPGQILGASSAIGHRLRQGQFPAPSETIEVDAAVLGGGIAGLAAARQLQRAGIQNLVLLELEDALGGNSRSGENAVSAYPWGAHYLPLPSEESSEVTALLEELKLIVGYTPEGLPLYDEYALCADPMERLFVNGTWQEGLVPRLDVTASDRAQIDAFLARMDVFRKACGRDGCRAFAIPVDRSSRDAEFVALDRLTMADYLDAQGWRAEPLRWYVDYCCRDDYGAGLNDISAWAGIHYFASRNARAGNTAPSAVLTWPEGNGWLVRELSKSLQGKLRTRSMVWSIVTQENGNLMIDYLDLRTERTTRLHARGAVCALPRFVANRLIHDPAFDATAPPLYSPWLVANATLSQLPSGFGEPLAWDNVFRQGRSLGYVVATHQSLASHPRETVITYYQPLDERAPAESRQDALTRSHADWCNQILGELRRAHPDIAEYVTHLDVWLWGHAMVRPTPDFIWGEARAKMQAAHGRLVFAHSDMSGISIFEEAYTRGTAAASVLAQQLQSSLKA